MISKEDTKMYPRIHISLNLVVESDDYKDWKFPLGSLYPAPLFSPPPFYRQGTWGSERLCCLGHTLQSSPGNPHTPSVWFVG